MPTCAASQQTETAAGDRSAHLKQLAMSTEYKTSSDRNFYKQYSHRHPPKARVPLIEREELFMAKLREERDTKGYSEAFSARRRFPIKPPAPEESDVASQAPSEA